ncbi:MAG: branched-chain amino acid ABC transporter permease [Sphingomonadaceae bacterium]
MKPRFSSNTLLTVAAAAVVLLLSWYLDGNAGAYPVKILKLWGINAILAASFILIYGYTGQFSLGHAGLAAVGAYVFSLCTLTPAQKQMMFILEPPIWPISVLHLPFLPTLLLAGLITAIVGFCIGAPALRLHGDYLLIATFGFSEIIRLAFSNMPSVVNGAMGLKGIPTNSTLPMVWAVVIVTLFCIVRLIRSSYGRALKSIRDDEIAAEALGVGLFYHKVMAFVVSSFFVGVAGGLYAEFLMSVDPRAFTSLFTYGIITMVVLGGTGSITGGVIAAGIYTVMSEVLRAVEDPMVIMGFEKPGTPGARLMIFSLMLLFLILFYRRGLMGSSEFSWDALRSRVGRLFGQRSPQARRQIQ